MSRLARCGDLTDAELGDELFENVDVFLQAYDDDGVDVGMLIERLKRVDDDRFAVHEQKLLGLGARIHALAGAARKNDSDVHALSTVICAFGLAAPLTHT